MNNYSFIKAYDLMYYTFSSQQLYQKVIESVRRVSQVIIFRKKRGNLGANNQENYVKYHKLLIFLYKQILFLCLRYQMILFQQRYKQYKMKHFQLIRDQFPIISSDYEFYSSLMEIFKIRGGIKHKQIYHYMHFIIIFINFICDERLLCHYKGFYCSCCKIDFSFLFPIVKNINENSHQQNKPPYQIINYDVWFKDCKSIRFIIVFIVRGGLRQYLRFSIIRQFYSYEFKMTRLTWITGRLVYIQDVQFPSDWQNIIIININNLYYSEFFLFIDNYYIQQRISQRKSYGYFVITVASIDQTISQLLNEFILCLYQQIECESMKILLQNRIVLYQLYFLRTVIKVIFFNSQVQYCFINVCEKRLFINIKYIQFPYNDFIVFHHISIIILFFYCLHMSFNLYDDVQEKKSQFEQSYENFQEDDSPMLDLYHTIHQSPPSQNWSINKVSTGLSKCIRKIKLKRKSKTSQYIAEGRNIFIQQVATLDDASQLNNQENSNILLQLKDLKHIIKKLKKLNIQ
ncbi:unnamed protein product (macronuclear) [Paramecium tetraurelia]|uniref:Transmembrane protein n=1 Tax=Paramecium tetraurelia TaxID=5888 RepID=A0BN11_PARTE|nr:uncharacterized protein GSPATT00030565001 [Paramecium tetraurelia]CAK59928.1 unnamed protein product [Paramecium tetraurelia]|eukprot:XP_001427326.1 hypothetical protein (macronuclear) [Paramecium tetraurelia strain d4-2]